MDIKKLVRKALMLYIFLLLFVVTPGFGKLNLDNDNKDKNDGWNRLTDETILESRTVNDGFELHCTEAPTKEVDVNMEQNIGLVSTEFIER
jgi:hypothetical protein